MVTITLSTVNVALKGPLGTAVPSAEILFQLPSFDVQGDAVILPAVQKIALDGDGEGAAAIYATVAGEGGFSYRVTARFTDSDTGLPVSIPLGFAAVPATGGPFDLVDLLTDAAPEPTSSDLLAAITAAVASTSANASTASTAAGVATTKAGEASDSALAAANSAASTGLPSLVGHGGKFIQIKADASGYEVKTASQMRTALGLGTAAQAATGDFATAAQGVLADAALPASRLISDTNLANNQNDAPTRGAVRANVNLAREVNYSWLSFSSALPAVTGNGLLSTNVINALQDLSECVLQFDGLSLTGTDNLVLDLDMPATTFTAVGIMAQIAASAAANFPWSISGSQLTCVRAAVAAEALYGQVRLIALGNLGESEASNFVRHFRIEGRYNTATRLLQTDGTFRITYPLSTTGFHTKPLWIPSITLRPSTTNSVDAGRYRWGWR